MTPTPPIDPTESELKAASEIRYYCNYPRTCTDERLAKVVATHTRHEGKTAKEWAEYAGLVKKNTEQAWKMACQRAEQAEARVKELEADLSGRTVSCVCGGKK